jgi:hypothetical protein
MLNFLVGAKLVAADNTGFEVVASNNKRYRFNFEEYEGDCCGYNTINSCLLIGDEIEQNPIITKVEHMTTDDEYSQRCKITFFGMSKPIYTAAIESGSGSGWCYGATVKLTCKEDGFDEILTSW